MASANLSGNSATTYRALPIECDKAGNAIFHPFRRPGQALDELLATDALRIGELKTSYVSATERDIFTPHKPGLTQSLVITTANADYLPGINLGEQRITFCEDGRWGAEDWAQWPQWYFDGQEYFAYVLRKPSGSDLDGHPLRILWWQMTEVHFIPQAQNIGVLNPNIAQQIYDVRSKFMEEVNTCSTSNADNWRILQEHARNMRSLTSSLLFTPQEYCSVLLTVAAAQRACLSTRAILDKIKKWDTMSLTSSPQVDTRILGCVTDRLSVVHEMFEKGVPVWYVRPITYLPQDINIVSPEPVVHPKKAGIITTPWKNAPIFYHGALSARIHDAINRWKPGTLDIRFLPSTSESPPEPESNVRPTPYPMSRALGKVGQKRKKRNLAINGTLFSDLTGPIATKAPPAWKGALESVVVDADRVIDHANQQIFRGYAFPPPQIFCSPLGQNNLELMLAWIVVRPFWMKRVSVEAASVLPSPQQWRKYLRDMALELELLRKDTRKKDVASVPPSSSTPSGSRGRKQKFDGFEDIFPLQVPTTDGITSLTWYNCTVWKRGQQVEFPIFCQKMLIWDSQEHNFRLELMTLDQIILPEIWALPGAKVARMDKIAALWPNNFILMNDLPSKSSGLAARDLSLRRFFLLAFQRLLDAWPGETPKRLSAFVLRNFVDERMIWYETALGDFERAASKFYCQLFFDYFGRAPCVPPELPVQ